MYKITIVSDVELETEKGPIRWAYANRAHALASHAPPQFQVKVVTHEKFKFGMVPRMDLVFFLDYSFAGRARREWDKCQWKKIPLVFSFNKDSKTKQNEYTQTVRSADWVICNNEQRWRFGGINPNTCCISNGVDCDFWTSTTPIEDRHKILWCGSSNPKKGKNYQNVIEPLGEMLEKSGVQCDFRPIDKITPNLNTPNEQRDWYNSGAVAVCASTSEGGGPSYMMEAASCGCAIVTTKCGSTPEWTDSGNSISCKPRIESAYKGVMEAIERKSELSAAMLDTIKNHSYGEPGNRAMWFYSLFEALIKWKRRDGGKVKPFTYRETPWTSIASPK